MAQAGSLSKLSSLLFLLNVPCVLAQTWAVLFQTQLFATWLAFERVIDIACFFTDQKDCF